MNLRQYRRRTRQPRMNSDSVQWLRRVIQLLFLLLLILIGWQYHLFVEDLRMGAETLHRRPPGAEGFLPISALMSGLYFLLSGNVNDSHPAALFILLAILAISLIFGKSFCSWFCPFGWLSEMLHRLHLLLFRRSLRIPLWLDRPLRWLKYLLLGYFLYAVLSMSMASLQAYLDGPYNQVADIKMYLFFAHPSTLALEILFGLLVLSILIPHFWCRYLCPYGALLGVVGLLSPTRIIRRQNSCTDCGLCDRACPHRIRVSAHKAVISDECTTCLRCVDACPVPDTLNLQLLPQKKKINGRLVALGVVLIFMVITGSAMLAGYWQNNITDQEYRYHWPRIKYYGH